MSLRKLLSLFEPLTDNPRFCAVSFLCGFFEPPSVGVSVTAVPKFGPASPEFPSSRVLDKTDLYIVNVEIITL